MDGISLGVPRPILDQLPEDAEDAAIDMQQAVGGWERRINDTLESAEDAGESAGVLLDAIDRLEARRETYDEQVPELRAWGQSPIYAIAWRTLYADLIAQLDEQAGEDLGRERNARLVRDGIRFGE